MVSQMLGRYLAFNGIFVLKLICETKFSGPKISSNRHRILWEFSSPIWKKIEPLSQPLKEMEIIDAGSSNNENTTSVLFEPGEIKLENLDKNPIDDDNNEIKEMLKNQDSKQKMSMMFSYIMELYKCLMSSLLTIFVPQSCGGEICSISENLSRDDTFGYVTLVFNFFTLFTFLVLYLNEARREFRLIKYLDVNQTKPRDNSSVENNLVLLSNDRKNNLVLLFPQ